MMSKFELKLCFYWIHFLNLLDCPYKNWTLAFNVWTTIFHFARTKESIFFSVNYVEVKSVHKFCSMALADLVPRHLILSIDCLFIVAVCVVLTQCECSWEKAYSALLYLSVTARQLSLINKFHNYILLRSLARSFVRVYNARAWLIVKCINKVRAVACVICINTKASKLITAHTALFFLSI